MTFKKLLPVALPVAIILALALTRLLPHMPNFAPISAMALFGAVYLSRYWAFAVPLLAMMLSDYLLLYVHPFSPQLFDFSQLYSPTALFHGTLPAVYASFILSGLIGLWLRNHKTPVYVVGAAAFCSLQFFLISNAAVWLGGFYGYSFGGLMTAYLAGLPFLQGTLFGDLFYTTTMFGAYEIARRFALRTRHAFA